MQLIRRIGTGANACTVSFLLDVFRPGDDTWSGVATPTKTILSPILLNGQQDPFFKKQVCCPWSLIVFWKSHQWFSLAAPQKDTVSNNCSANMKSQMKMLRSSKSAFFQARLKNKSLETEHLLFHQLRKKNTQCCEHFVNTMCFSCGSACNCLQSAAALSCSKFEHEVLTSQMRCQILRNWDKMKKKR